MYAILGDYKFQDYKGFQELEVEDEIVLSEHPVINGKPRLQATGQKLRQIVIKFLLHSTFSDPESDMRILQGYRLRSEIVPFLSGDGTSFGNFVIKNITTDLTQTNKKGSIIGVEVSITLLEAVIPDTNRQPQNKLATKIPGVTVLPLAPRSSDPQLISKNLRLINTHTNAMLKELSLAARVASSVDRAFRSSKNRIAIIKTGLSNIEKIGTQTQKIATSYTSAKGSINQVKNSTEALSVFVNAGDLNSSIQGSTQLRNSMGKLNVDAAPINNLTATRREADPVGA